MCPIVVCVRRAITCVCLSRYDSVRASTVTHVRRCGPLRVPRRVDFLPERRPVGVPSLSSMDDAVPMVAGVHSALSGCEQVTGGNLCGVLIFLGNERWLFFRKSVIKSLFITFRNGMIIL